MSYLDAIAASAAPFGVPGPQRQLGQPPAAPPAPVAELTAPSYDAALDPSWATYLSPTDHPWRNFVNGLDDAERQLLRQKLVQYHSMPPPQDGLFKSVQGANNAGPILPASTSRAPGTF